MATYGYIRVSTDKQHLSLEAQEERLQSYCKFRGMKLDEIFADEDVSGSKPIMDRPEGETLCETVRKGDTVIAVKLDRCFRDAADGINTIFWWQDQGITLHLADEGTIAETDTAFGFLSIAIQLVVGQYERMATSERTRHVMRHAQANGKRMSRYLPYGWEADLDSEYNAEIGMYEKIKECPEEQIILSEIYRLNDAGLGYQGIANELNKSGYKKRNGKEWERQTVWNIISKK